MTYHKQLLSTILPGLLIFLFSFFFATSVSAQEPALPSEALPTDTSFQRARITNVETEYLEPNPAAAPSTARTMAVQTISFQIPGDETEYTVSYGSEFTPLSEDQLLRTGQTIIVQATPITDQSEAQPTYQIVDIFRLNTWLVLFAFFLLLVFAVARWRGLLSVVGMSATIIVLSVALIPAFSRGYDPLLVSIFGAIALSALTLYITHGWNMTTHIAYFSIVSVLLSVGLLSYGSVQSMHLTGLGSEEALFVRFLGSNEIRLQGLLLGGILLGTLGVLDDIIVSQIAVVQELFASKPKIGFAELFQRSLRVGQTHVASLVNTLVLVYAGANLPLFLLFADSPEPLWVTLNSELVMEEMVRTITGSIGLVTAVPVSTFLAAASLLILPKILDRPIDLHSSHHHTHKHPH